jgi:hypothetical protein
MFPKPVSVQPSVCLLIPFKQTYRSLPAHSPGALAQQFKLTADG